MKQKIYSPTEERLNIWSHGFGVILSCIGLLPLISIGMASGSMVVLFANLIYGVSALLLFLASTLYHRSTEEKARRRAKVFDHCAIYLLIAGSYTPFSLIALRDSIGFTILITVWSIALVGIVLKLFFTGRFSVLSTLSYVAMGWVVAFAAKPLYDALSPTSFFLLVLGGVLYTVGAVLYSIQRIPYNHAIFHFFVLLAAVAHYFSILGLDN